MRLEQVELTPTDARALLIASEGARQRPISPDRVARIAHDITRGQWLLTHQPIAIDPDGVVIDGQHRLAAIAQSGVTVPVLLARDADPDTFPVIDTGAARTPANTLAIAGYTNVNVTAATVRTVLAYQATVGESVKAFRRAGSIVTTSDVVGFLDSEQGETILAAIRPATAVASGVGRYGLASPVAAALAVITLGGGGEAARGVFADRLADGVRLDVGNPIYSLRRYYLGENLQAARRRSGHAAVLVPTLRAWNAYATGRELHVVRFTADDTMPRVALPGAEVESDTA